MDFQEFKTLVIAKAQAMEIAEYELYYQVAESVIAEAFGHEINRFSANNAGGVCFRCIVDGKMGYASTERLDEKQAEQIVIQAVENGKALESDEPVFLAAGGQEYAQASQRSCAFPQTDALLETVLQTQQALYDSAPQVVDGSTSRGVAERLYTAICNSKGLDVASEHVLSALMVNAVVESCAEKANDFQIKLDRLERVDIPALAAKASQTALSKLGGEPAPTGVYPVVFDPEAMSSLLDAFSGIFSGEAAQKGLSRLADSLGQKIAAPVVNLVDDPDHPDNPMPMTFDGEGSPTYKKYVIQKGVLHTLLHNLKTANLAGVQTTGNGAKTRYDASVGIQPFTMYLEPGAYSRDQLLEMAQNGVYIRTLSGLHAGANDVTGDFSLQSEGYLIEDGKLTTHVKAFTVAGNFYDLLQNITALGNDLELPSPADQTAFGSPTVLVSSLSVAGK